MLDTISKIQKTPRTRDHGNATMTQDQRKWVQEQIFTEYRQSLILNTKVLKARIIFYANQYISLFGKGKSVFEMRKSTFYDFLRLSDIPLPKKYYKNMMVNFRKRVKNKEESSEKETTEVKLEEENNSNLKEPPQTMENVISGRKTVDCGTQTENFNLFMSVLTMNGWVLLPLQRPDFTSAPKILQ